MQTEKLAVTLIQTALVWEHPQENRKQLEEKINAIQERTDIIILPEMFTSGFTMQPENVAETMDGETVSWMRNLAKTTQAAITGSVVISENDNFYNRLLFVFPDGAIETYDKRHTFTLAGEDKVYARGSQRKMITYKGWKLCPQICYDLRFPVWSRNVDDYDVIFYVANWPKKRTNAWDALLKARAVENMSYSIGVNRVGLDANSHEYVGHSAVYDVLGENITNIPSAEEAVVTVVLDKKHIEDYRNKLKFLADRDQFSITD